MKTEHVFSVAALVWCLTLNSAHADAQGSSESKPIDNRNVGDENVAPAFTIPSPSELIGVQKPTKPDENVAPVFTLPSGPMASDVIGGVQSPTNPDDVALVTKLPGGAIVAPSGELLGAQNATNSTPVTTINKPETFPSVFFLSATAIGALTALVWWRKRKNKRHKKSIRRGSSLYEARVR
jgi:hypothetical protein